jgi:hypothetical protein
MREHYLLGEVSRALGRKPYHVTHVLTTGKVPEPALRIANKRLFTAEDVERLARHFRVSPDWGAIETATPASDDKAPERLTLRPPFEVLQVGETGHEIRDAEGEIFAWATDRGRAMVLAGLLEAATRG